MKCKICKEKVKVCYDCGKQFKDENDIGCVNTDFFGDGKTVINRHICRDCFKRITGK